MGKPHTTKKAAAVQEDSFDADVSDFNSSTDLDIKDSQLAQQLQQDPNQFKILRSPVLGSLSREESRNNSIIGSLIDDELDSDTESAVASRATSSGSAAAARAASGPVRIYDVRDLIDALNKPRNKINTDARHFLLGQAYKMVNRRPRNVDVNEEDMEQLISFVKSSRSDLETVLAIKLATAYAATDSDEVGSQVMDEFIPLLFSKIFNDESSPVVCSNAIMAYFALLLVMFDGSDCYSLADNVGDFLELVEGYSKEGGQSMDVVANALNGVGVILSLLYKSGHKVNELIEDTTPRVLPFLSPEYPASVHKAAAILIGLMYEIYDYRDEDADGPYYDDEELKTELKSLANEGTKKTGKKDKKETRSIYKEVSSLIERRQEEQERGSDTEGGDEDEEEPVLSRMALGKSKQLPIKSWFEFVRLLALKYAFDTELSSHYLNSREIRSILAKPDADIDYDDEDEVPMSSGKHWNTRDEKLTGKKKEQRIHKARDHKLQDEMEDLNI